MYFIQKILKESQMAWSDLAQINERSCRKHTVERKGVSIFNFTAIVCAV